MHLKKKIARWKCILSQMDDWETWLMKQYTEHPVLFRFCVCVFLATLSLLQHLLDKQGLVHSLSTYLNLLSSIITKFFLKGGE